MTPPTKKKELEVQDSGNVTIVNFTRAKILDDQVIQSIGEQLFGLVDAQGKQNILLNFAKVEYLSSAALGKLISLNKKIATVKGKLALCNIAPSIIEVFDITGLRKVFKIFPDEQEAMQSF